MIADLGPDLDVAPGESPINALWNQLKREIEFPRLPYKVKMCQWMGFHRRNQQLLREWSTLLFKTELLGLELDFFQGRCLREYPRTRWHWLRQETLRWMPNQCLSLTCCDCKWMSSARFQNMSRGP